MAAALVARVQRRRIRVRGTVQGVGFRPFVHREAQRLDLAGWVRNDSEGVLIEVEGPESALDELCDQIASSPPALAVVDEIEWAAMPPEEDSSFRIVPSDDHGPRQVPVGVDTATCPACLSELFDPDDRRHRYPFINCTDCGPRYTIVRSVPYDRPATTMAGFAMCRRCREEYEDPSDRRFHAQPNACWDCGPRLQLVTPDGAVVHAGASALDEAVALLRHGGIVAVKGLGGYHLAVDATDAGAVAELRRRKARDHKPLAVMVGDLEAANRLCRLEGGTRQALVSPDRPIVIAPARRRSQLAPGVAPGLDEIGLMLPYTPLHALLMADVERPLVMTSGNLTDEPIAHDDDDARERLGPLVDVLLVHDRPIHIRCDDSVVRARPAGVQVLRRSRGHAPRPMSLPLPTPRQVLAVGGELKNTIALARGPMVVVSHHVGDLEHLATWRSFEQAVTHLADLHAMAPEVVAHDLHPEYLSTKWALESGLEPVGVQHHHAHVASCMVEHGRTEPVVGVAFDGHGYGPDASLWGGEVLVADLSGFRRVGHVQEVPLAGGTTAIREPWRMAVVWALASGGTELAERVGPRLGDRWQEVATLASSGHPVPTTSAGRLFDAVAALLGVRSIAAYEGHAASELEALARRASSAEATTYQVDVIGDPGGAEPAVIDPTAMIGAIVDDVARGVAPARIATGFHHALGRGAAALAAHAAAAAGIGTVVLTGGVFQNSLLSEVVEEELVAAGLEVLVHRAVPPNDGGISVGQAAIAAARIGRWVGRTHIDTVRSVT